MVSTVSLPRCLAVAAAASVTPGGLVAWLLPVVLESGGATFDAALVRLCAALALVASGWLWLATVLTVGAALRSRGPGGRASHAGLPAPLRRAVLAACGVALTGGVGTAAPAYATPGHPHEDRVASPAALVVGLPLPDRAVAPPPAARDRRDTVVVAPGDTLWAIAARTLEPGASDAEVDARWRELYALNRAAIGPDPHLIHPALRLEVLP